MKIVGGSNKDVNELSQLDGLFFVFKAYHGDFYQIQTYSVIITMVANISVRILKERRTVPMAIIKKS